MHKRCTRSRRMPTLAEYVQYAALPYVQLDGDIRVCLLTSRETKRWVIPKGWPKPPFAPHEQAAREAKEEGGLVGDISAESIGSYTYRKRLLLAEADCRVAVYPLLVRAQRGRWREQAERQLVWVSVNEAAGMVAEPELGRLLSLLPFWLEAQPVA